MVTYTTAHTSDLTSNKNWLFPVAIAIGVRAIFLPGGVNYLPKNFSQVAQIFTKQSKRNEACTMQQHRPTYEVKVFLHMNLSYELITHVKINSCLCHFDGENINDTIHVTVDYRVVICPFNVNKS